MRRTLSSFGAAVLLGGAGCGGAAPPRAESAPLAPATERDPPPYAPAPASSVGRTGDTTALTADAGYEPARAVAVSFLRALLEADRGALSTLLVDSVVLGRQRAATQPRATFVQEALHWREANPLPQLLTLDQVVEPQRVGVRAMSAYEVDHPALASIPAFADSDVVVIVPLRLAGRRLFHPWPGGSHAQVVIRPGLEPRVVGVL